MSVELKAKAWDLYEALEERKNFEITFFGSLGDLLGLADEQRADPQNYFNAIVELKEKTKLTDGSVGELVN